MKIEIQQTISGSEKIGKDCQIDLDNEGITIGQTNDNGTDEVELTWPEAAVLAGAIQDALKQIGKLRVSLTKRAEVPRQKPGRKPALCGTHQKPYKECGCARAKAGGTATADQQRAVSNPAPGSSPKCPEPKCMRLNGHPGVHSFEMGEDDRGWEIKGPLPEGMVSGDFELIANQLEARALPCGRAGEIIANRGDSGKRDGGKVECGPETAFAIVFKDKKKHGAQFFPRCVHHMRVLPAESEILAFDKGDVGDVNEATRG